MFLFADIYPDDFQHLQPVVEMLQKSCGLKIYYLSSRTANFRKEINTAGRSGLVFRLHEEAELER